MFFERHLENIIELFIPDVTEPKTVLNMVQLSKNYVKRLDIAQLLPPIREPQGEKEEEEYESELEIGNEDDESCMHHFDFSILLDKLTNLEELHLVYRVKQCGMNFEWAMFEMTEQDCESLAKALKSCKTLKVNIDSSPCFLATFCSITCLHRRPKVYLLFFSSVLGIFKAVFAQM